MIVGNFTVDPKISEVNATKILSRMMERYQVGSLREDVANRVLSKIMTGKISFEKDEIHYSLFQSIDFGGEKRKVVALKMPDSKVFADNKLKISDFNVDGEITSETISKFAALTLGLPSESSDLIPIKDHLGIFEVGCLFFLAD